MSSHFRHPALYAAVALLAAAAAAFGVQAARGGGDPLGAAVPPAAGANGTSATGATVFAREDPDATARVTDTDEEAQSDTMPTLPDSMSVDMIAAGDAIFHGRGGCYQCHGAEATGLKQRGSALTAGTIYVPVQGPHGWNGIDSLVLNGIPESLTRTQVAMPMRGLHSDLSADEVRRVAAYVWAIAQVRGEPWPGGHLAHGTPGRVIPPRTTGP
jgi:mono/diheme cytochrome c family protein